jgi:uncharacterized protein
MTNAPGELFDTWINPNLGAHQGAPTADHLFPGLADRRQRGTTLDQLVDEMDAANVRAGLLTTGYTADDTDWVLNAIDSHPSRFWGAAIVDPREGMAAVQQAERMVVEHDFRLIRTFGLMTQLPYNAPEYYPLYAKCCELGVPIGLNVGLPGPRVPGRSQHPMAIDDVCAFFPDLKIVMSHGGQPWAPDCVHLMAKWPNLSFMSAAVAPKYVAGEIIDFANTRGGHKIMWGSDYPMLTFERCAQEIPNMPFRSDELRRKYQFDNAVSLFVPELT